jgi:hypothetical protein
MSSERLVAIHQPNFFPWLGYFNKVVRADVFVVLDDAQFQKTGGTWCNRVRILVAGKASWVTMPVDRSYHGLVGINNVHSRSDIPWREKLLATIRSNYGRTQFFDDYFPELSALVTNPDDGIATYNLKVITALCGRLSLDVSKFVLASSLGVEASATGRLVELVRRVGGNAYLSGLGAGGYQQDELFQAAGITLRYQQFTHTIYQQKGAPSFVPGLSVIDALMNCGTSETAAMLAGN